MEKHEDLGVWNSQFEGHDDILESVISNRTDYVFLLVLVVNCVRSSFQVLW